MGICADCRLVFAAGSGLMSAEDKGGVFYEPPEVDNAGK